MPNPTSDQPDDDGTSIIGRDQIAERIDNAVHAAIAHQQAAQAAIEHRNRVIAEAHDQHGWSTNELARKAHLAQSSIMRILASV